MKILLIESERHATGLGEQELGQLGIQLEVASDRRRGIQRARSGGHEVVLLDLLPQELGSHRVLAELRRRNVSVPVLVLSTRDGVGDRVRALNEGADDFLVKPFDLVELVARVRALVRRTQRLDGRAIEVADLRMDPRTRRVERAGRLISLTAREFALLGFLLKNREAVVTREMIAEQVWGQHFGSISNVIDVYVRYLRAKIDAGCEPKLIHTLRGVGYVLSESRH